MSHDTKFRLLCQKLRYYYKDTVARESTRATTFDFAGERQGQLLWMPQEKHKGNYLHVGCGAVYVACLPVGVAPWLFDADPGVV